MGWESFDIRTADRLTAEGTRILGILVRRRREALGWSQRRLAAHVGCHQSVISRLERGLLVGIRYRRFARIIGVMGGLEPDAPLPAWSLDRPGRNPYLARLAAEQARAAEEARLAAEAARAAEEARLAAEAARAATRAADQERPPTEIADRTAPLDGR